MFLSSLGSAPTDPIFGLNESFQKDSNPNKLNLGIGVYKDNKGQMPKFKAVAIAERRLLDEDFPQTYLPIEGHGKYLQQVQRLLFRADSSVLDEDRLRSVQTPGGTGGLHIAAEFLSKFSPNSVVWVSSPTWANHKAVFAASSLEVKEYSYFKASSNSLAFEELIDSLSLANDGDVVLLHGCCHNPTGLDPSDEEWGKIFELIGERELLPLVDFAYQGFGRSIEEDASVLKMLADTGRPYFIANSFSKNFGLYNQRLGALTFVGETPEQAEIVLGHMKRCIRAAYSNPPAHGARLVSAILEDPELSELWTMELDSMRERLNDIRSQLVSRLNDALPDTDFSFFLRQRGMFSFTGLSVEQVDRLRKEFGIYLLSSGRLSIPGVNSSNIDYLLDALLKVIGS